MNTPSPVFRTHWATGLILATSALLLSLSAHAQPDFKERLAEREAAREAAQQHMLENRQEALKRKQEEKQRAPRFKTVEEQVEWMTQNLYLDAQQQGKVRALLAQDRAKRKQIREQYSGQGSSLNEQARTQLAKQKTAHREQLQSVLTREQYRRYEEVMGDRLLNADEKQAKKEQALKQHTRQLKHDMQQRLFEHQQKQLSAPQQERNGLGSRKNGGY